MERRWSGRREGKNGKSEGGISVGGEWRDEERVMERRQVKAM